MNTNYRSAPPHITTRNIAPLLVFALLLAVLAGNPACAEPAVPGLNPAPGVLFPSNDSPPLASSETSTDQREFLPVDKAYRLEPTTTADTLRLSWEIADGYYLYRHGFRVTLNDQEVTAIASIPDGIIKQDDLFGEVQVYYRQVAIELPLPDDDSYRLEVQSQGCADAGLCYPPHNQYFEFAASGQPVKSTAPPPIATSGRNAVPAEHRQTPQAAITLPLAAALAFLGGLILNLMPCVLPVLSLKAIGLISSTASPDERIAHGWWYTLGIVISFGAVATVLIGLKWAGANVGWGFQLQSPWFVAALTYLFFVLALLMIGAADFSGSWMGFGQSLASGEGYRGSFFTGALATLVASPCTAPFMGTAMGFALTQNASTALLIFLCLGLGMASPFLLISYLPGTGRWLPKPGPWMERFRQFLAFPLLATAIWLLWVIGRQTGADAVTLVLGGCLLLALALWFNGRTAQVQLARGALLTIALLMLTHPHLHRPATDAQAATREQDRYSQKRVEQLQAGGRAVFVNFTADWCITCLANENWVLSRSEIKMAFEQLDVTYLKADWTNRDPGIAADLERFGRSGIPLYVFYPADKHQDAIILPQILSVDLVLQVLREHSPEQTMTANL